MMCIYSSFAEERFGRPVIKLDDAKQYEYLKLDDVKYPLISSNSYAVTCLVYRGRERYYVEIGIKNKTSNPVLIGTDFVALTKPGYTVFRTDELSAARESGLAAGLRFTPTATPYVPPTYNTTIDATATTTGNQTQVYGTATSTADNSGQAGANVGNAIGNAIAAHRFYKAQRTEAAFSAFLMAHSQADSGFVLQPGDAKTVVATFQQAKQKKAPFEVVVQVGDDSFNFKYKE